MIALSLTTGYAIKALTCLASGDCPLRPIHDIARCTGVPRAYLPQILRALARKRLVHTKRGYHGGISLARNAEDISPLQIVEAVEGKKWIAACLLGMEGCDAITTCPTHKFWARIRQEIIEELRKTSLAALMTASRRRGPHTREIQIPKKSSACSRSSATPA